LSHQLPQNDAAKGQSHFAQHQNVERIAIPSPRGRQKTKVEWKYQTNRQNLFRPKNAGSLLVFHLGAHALGGFHHDIYEL
jgi:transposase